MTLPYAHNTKYVRRRNFNFRFNLKLFHYGININRATLHEKLIIQVSIMLNFGVESHRDVPFTLGS
jgi:hypothetical protein